MTAAAVQALKELSGPIVLVAVVFGVHWWRHHRPTRVRAVQPRVRTQPRPVTPAMEPPADDAAQWAATFMLADLAAEARQAVKR